MSTKSIRQQFADTMLEVGQQDENLVVVVGDISHFNLQPFAKACPGRFYNIGICEPGMLSVGAGISKAGLTPVLHTISPFIVERGMEQLKLDFGYHKLAGNLITVGGAFDYSYLGVTHHCYNDFALLKMIEGSEILHPGTCFEFDTLFRQTYKSQALTLTRVPGNSHDVELGKEDIRFGKAVKVADGTDVTIVVTGPQLSNAMAARKLLTNRGHSVEVLYVHTIRPLDTPAILESVAKTKRVVVVEEHFENGGLGDDVLRAVKDLPGFRFGSRNLGTKFVRTYNSYEGLCALVGLSPEGIAAAAEELFSDVRRSTRLDSLNAGHSTPQ